MHFLSVAGREIRVAARKRSSFRIRLFTAAIGSLVAGFAVSAVTLFGSRPNSGEQLFFTLSWVSFLCACMAGPALTADCVNEERNNGTLGLLFLTNLNGISISLGKLAGHGLLALYSIVSIIPVMAFAALLGGTDAESLLKTALVLVVTLILSLITGMFASTVCRKTWVAAGAAFAIMAGFAVGVPLLAMLLRMKQNATVAAWLELLSPSYSLSMARGYAAMLPSNRLWAALAVQLLIAVSLFALVSFLLPRAWKEGVGKKREFLSSAWRSLKYGSGEVRNRLRARLLDINPILWLSARERFGTAGDAIVLLALAGAVSWVGRVASLRAANGEFFGQMLAWILGIPLLYIWFCFRLAAAASERFAVDRKTRALELVVCTPLNTREIIRGHWLGLLRKFWGAAILLLALHAFALNYIIDAIRLEPQMAQFGFREIAVRPVRHLLGAGRIPNEVAPLYIACLAVLTAAILIVMLWVALGWLGMALSLKLKRQIFAPWVSLFLLAAPPIPVFIGSVALLDNKQLFASNLFLGLLRIGASGFFIVLANAALWLLLARRRTYRELRVERANKVPQSHR